MRIALTEIHSFSINDSFSFASLSFFCYPKIDFKKGLIAMSIRQERLHRADFGQLLSDTQTTLGLMTPRAKELFGYDFNSFPYQKMKNCFKQDIVCQLQPDKPLTVRSTMEQGPQMLFAEAATELRDQGFPIRVIGDVPSVDSIQYWPDDAKARFHTLASHMDKVYVYGKTLDDQSKAARTSAYESAINKVLLIHSRDKKLETPLPVCASYVPDDFSPNTTLTYDAPSSSALPSLANLRESFVICELNADNINTLRQHYQSGLGNDFLDRARKTGPKEPIPAFVGHPNDPLLSEYKNLYFVRRDEKGQLNREAIVTACLDIDDMTISSDMSYDSRRYNIGLYLPEETVTEEFPLLLDNLASYGWPMTVYGKDGTLHAKDEHSYGQEALRSDDHPITAEHLAYDDSCPSLDPVETPLEDLSHEDQPSKYPQELEF